MHLPKKMTFINVEKRIAELDEAVRVVVPRRDAQEYDDIRRDYFQQQIKTLSDELIRWQEIEDDLGKLEHLYNYLYTQATEENKIGDEAISQRLKAANLGMIPTAILILAAIVTMQPLFIVLALLACAGDAYAWYLWIEAVKETAESAASGEDGIIAEIKRVEDKIRGLYRYAVATVDDEDAAQPVT